MTILCVSMLSKRMAMGTAMAQLTSVVSAAVPVLAADTAVRTVRTTTSTRVDISAQRQLIRCRPTSDRKIFDLDILLAHETFNARNMGRVESNMAADPGSILSISRRVIVWLIFRLPALPATALVRTVALQKNQ